MRVLEWVEPHSLACSVWGVREVLLQVLLEPARWVLPSNLGKDRNINRFYPTATVQLLW